MKKLLDEFKEFALLGINGLDPKTMYFVNYVSHAPIPKPGQTESYEGMKLTRTIKLKFPLGEGHN